MAFRKPRRLRRAIHFVAVIAMMCLALVATAGSASNSYLGSMSGVALHRPIVGLAATRDGHGYWLVAADGGVFTFGDAHFYGSTGGRALNAPIVAIAATHSGHGYWLVARDGGIFTFGDAHFYGSTGRRALRSPIVGIATTRSGRGYWLVAADGGVFTFGDAHFHGSAGGRRLGAPIVGIAATRSSRGYWLVASDGGVFTFGDAPFFGSAIGRSISAPIVGISATRTGTGYWLVAGDGSTYSFGHAKPLGTKFPAAKPRSAVVTIAASPRGGYWVASLGGTVGVSTKRPTSTSTSSHTTSIAFQLMLRMNAERSARHLAPLGWDGMLAQRANTWAQSLLADNQFRHQSLASIAQAAGGRFEELGENLFSGTGGAADAGTAHLALMHSLAHRQNMLLPQGQLVGIGAACGGGKLVVVEDFAIDMGAPLPPAGQPDPPVNPIIASNPAGAHC